MVPQNYLQVTTSSVTILSPEDGEFEKGLLLQPVFEDEGLRRPMLFIRSTRKDERHNSTVMLRGFCREGKKTECNGNEQPDGVRQIMGSSVLGRSYHSLGEDLSTKEPLKAVL